MHSRSAALIQRRWCRYQNRCFTAAKSTLRERCRCCVCHDECVHVVVCANGHAVCAGCDAVMDVRACPLCRAPRGERVDATIPAMTTCMQLRMHCAQCDVYLPTEHIEFHRAWCPAFEFECPVEGCAETVTAAAMCDHVTRHHRPYRGAELTLAVSRFSSSVACVVDDHTVVVLTCTPEQYGGGETFASHAALHMRAYYASPRAPPLLATVTQRRVVDVWADTFLERFHVGVVTPVLASRERVVLTPYAPHVTPRCLLTNDPTPVLGKPPLLLSDVVRDLQRYGIRDIPVSTRPQRPRDLPGVPVAIVTVAFTVDGGAIGELYDC